MSETQKLPNPYLSVSGGVSSGDQDRFASIVERHDLEQLGYKAIWGVQANETTMLNVAPSSWGEGWHPVGDKIAYAAYRDEGAVEAFAYVYGGRDFKTISRTFDATLERTEHFASGVRINGSSWGTDTIHTVERLRYRYPDLKIILQSGELAMRDILPSQVANLAGRMMPEHVLFDPSGIWDSPLDREFVEPFIYEMFSQDVPIGVGVAGGFSAETLEGLYMPLASEYPGLSLDAEARLRSGESSQTYLDLEKVEAYVATFKELMTTVVDVEEISREAA